jgi:hypothetical protein
MPGGALSLLPIAGFLRVSALLARSSPFVAISERPDFAWIKKFVPILQIARELGLPIYTKNWIRCWRPERHKNSDAHPSLHLYERNNRARCFVCDMRVGHSNIDLVVAFFKCDFADAVAWICRRFPVPEIRPGRPVGARVPLQQPDRVGITTYSDVEILVRSGLFGQLSSAEAKIALVLYFFRDPETGLTRISYGGIMRYAGIGSRKSISGALRHLQNVHALQINRSPRVGVTRDCSTYRITLEDEKFLDLCNETFKRARNEVEQERTHRRKLRITRQKQAGARVNSRRALIEAEKSGIRKRMRYSPVTFVTKTSPTRESYVGLDLSSPEEPRQNKSVPIGNHEISTVPQGPYCQSNEPKYRRFVGKQEVEVECWHCQGKGRCACSACWRRYPGELAECAACKGTGKLAART